MSNQYGGLKRGYANQSASLTGLPGATMSTNLKYQRDNMNVDDIEGAVPRRLVGYTGARPDVLLQKEAQINGYSSPQRLNLQPGLTNNVNQMLPAGYLLRKGLPENINYPQNNGIENKLQELQNNDQLYKTYEQRQLRTDDIQGAQPKSYGNQINGQSFAGSPTGNTKAYRNDSEIFKNVQQETGHQLQRGSYNTQSSPALQKIKAPQTFAQPFNPQFQTSYMQQYLSNKNFQQQIQLARPLKPDTNLMFQGHREVSGGLSGSEGVGNLISTFQTTYQKNYNQADDLKRQIEAEKYKKTQFEVERHDLERFNNQMKQKSPERNEGQQQNNYASINANGKNYRTITQQNYFNQDYSALNGEESIPKHFVDRAVAQDSMQHQRQVSQQGQDEKASDSYQDMLEQMKQENPNFLRDMEIYYATKNAAESKQQEPQRNSNMRSSLILSGEQLIKGDSRQPISQQSSQLLSASNQRREDQLNQERSMLSSTIDLREDRNSYKHLSMAPTTDQGMNHQIIDKDIQNRESSKYGNPSVAYETIMPKLNDIGYHRTSQRAKNNFNVLTGTYRKGEQ